MTGYNQLVKEAHDLATQAMAQAKADYIATVKSRGDEAWANAVRNCGGEHAVEPMYCGRATVIVPRKANPEFVKAMKAQGGDTRGNGYAIGHSRKGLHTPSDWSFYCPGTYYGQSMDIYETGAQAFLAHLTANGIVGAFMQSRAD